MLTLIPRVSEKAYASASTGTYVFGVPMNANKATVAAALKDQYQVTASDIRFVVMKGKPVRASRGKRAQPVQVVRSKRKKAYVTLDGDAKLDLYGNAEEENS
ncbi:MAG TPA: 50S ribosomal protein L23 [Candidatus Saccharimonadales bacterium]|jgi:ribosomal protein L23